MAIRDRRSCRIYDGVRDSKIHWDTRSNFDRKTDSSEYGRVFPRPCKGDDITGYSNFEQDFISKIDEIDSRLQAYTEKEDPFHEFHHKHNGLIAKFKYTFPVFDGFWKAEDLKSWIATIEDFFEDVSPPEHVKCRIVWSKMEGAAYYWWKFLQNDRVMDGKEEISSWPKMKKLLISRFVPARCSTKLPNQLDKLEKSKEVKHSIVDDCIPSKCLSKVLTEAYIEKQKQEENSDDDLEAIVVEDQTKETAELRPDACSTKVSLESEIDSNEGEEYRADCLVSNALTVKSAIAHILLPVYGPDHQVDVSVVRLAGSKPLKLSDHIWNEFEVKSEEHKLKDDVTATRFIVRMQPNFLMPISRLFENGKAPHNYVFFNYGHQYRPFTCSILCKFIGSIYSKFVSLLFDPGGDHIFGKSNCIARYGYEIVEAIVTILDAGNSEGNRKHDVLDESRDDAKISVDDGSKSLMIGSHCEEYFETTSVGTNHTNTPIVETQVFATIPYHPTGEQFQKQLYFEPSNVDFTIGNKSVVKFDPGGVSYQHTFMNVDVPSTIYYSGDMRQTEPSRCDGHEQLESMSSEEPTWLNLCQAVGDGGLQQEWNESLMYNLSVHSSYIPRAANKPSIYMGIAKAEFKHDVLRLCLYDFNFYICFDHGGMTPGILAVCLYHELVTYLTYGEFMANTHLATKLALFLFDPGGIFYSVRPPNISLRHELLAILLFRNGSVMLRNHDWRGIGTRDEVVCWDVFFLYKPGNDLAIMIRMECGTSVPIPMPISVKYSYFGFHEELHMTECLDAAGNIYSVLLGELQLRLYHELPKPGVIVVDDRGQLTSTTYKLYVSQVLILNLLLGYRIMVMFDPGGARKIGPVIKDKQVFHANKPGCVERCSTYFACKHQFVSGGDFLCASEKIVDRDPHSALSMISFADNFGEVIPVGTSSDFVTLPYGQLKILTFDVTEQTVAEEGLHPVNRGLLFHTLIPFDPGGITYPSRTQNSVVPQMELQGVIRYGNDATECFLAMSMHHFFTTKKDVSRNPKMIAAVYLCVVPVIAFLANNSYINEARATTGALTTTHVNLTRGRVIQWERWNDVSQVTMQFVGKNGQTREALRLFCKLVNGLDPPNMKMCWMASVWTLESSLVDELFCVGGMD